MNFLLLLRDIFVFKRIGKSGGATQRGVNKNDTSARNSISFRRKDQASKEQKTGCVLLCRNMHNGHHSTIPIASYGTSLLHNFRTRLLVERQIFELFFINMF